MNVFNMTMQITLILKFFSTLTARVSFTSMHSLNLTLKVTFPLKDRITPVTIVGICLLCYFVDIVRCFLGMNLFQMLIQILLASNDLATLFTCVLNVVMDGPVRFPVYWIALKSRKCFVTFLASNFTTIRMTSLFIILKSIFGTKCFLTHLALVSSFPFVMTLDMRFHVPNAVEQFVTQRTEDK